MKRPALGHPFFRLWQALFHLRMAAAAKTTAGRNMTPALRRCLRGEAALDLRAARTWLRLWLQD